MTLGSLGICKCGYIAVAHCEGCGILLCDTHATQLPEPPTGLSENAVIKFAGAVRLMGGQACVSCREDRGRRAISEAIGAPRQALPNHWLDRAIALSSDQTRSEEERLFDGQLPATLTPSEVAAEFLRRMNGKTPHESVAVTESTWLHRPEFAYGWRVECRRTEYTHHWPSGATERYSLPLLISVSGELLGPVLEGDSPSATWYVVSEDDVDLTRFVAAVAGLLVLSPFEA